LLETRRMPSKRYSLSDLRKLEFDELKAQKEKDLKKSNTAPTTPTVPRHEQPPPQTPASNLLEQRKK
jgi:hypothetical protein